jgi:magnesium-transporting ATPase (P-type)
MRVATIHTLRPGEVYSALDTSPGGLSSGESGSRLQLYGPNALPAAVQPSPWRKLLGHIAHPMALLLWGAGLLALLIGHPTLPWVIWLVVLMNAGFSFWQEYRAQQAVAALSHLLPSYSRVERDGEEVLIPTEQVVPGDVLVLAQGDNIAADARVVEQYGLRANQAALTGEALAATKTEQASLREGLTELEQPNLVYAGSSVVSGTGRAVVFATGTLTQFGRIARLTQVVEEVPSPLQKEITRLTRIISIIAIAIGLGVFTVAITDIGIVHSEAFLLAIGIIVAVMPEGLRPTLTLSLAIAVQRLARREVLVKKLAVVETLGRVSVVCTDKSGTLTHNQMTVRELWVAGRRMQVSGAGYEPEGTFSPVTDGMPLESDLETALTAAMLCNNARLLPPTADRLRWSSLGDQTEAALRVCALKADLDEKSLISAYPRIHELPFDATRKRMSTIHLNGRGEIAFVKGAPKEVLARCSHVLMDGEVRPLDAQIVDQIMAANDEFARQAMRVLALARRDLPPREGSYTPENVERNLTFLGLAAMTDPPRKEVAAAMRAFREAGIRVVMITGDYGLTAESMARRLGMLHTNKPRILTGADLDPLSDAELSNILSDEVIFARVAPEHKLRVVAAFQSRGDVVAVIGDGVNDAPALRKADIGAAMGRVGTDVAREAADIILTNDNFAALASAIEEGRAIFENIRKFITYILASNIPEIMPFVLTALLHIPLALTVAQILAIDLGTDLLPALALGTEHPEPDVMARVRRVPSRRLMDRGLIVRSLWLGGIETLLCYIAFGAVYFAAGYFPVPGLPRPDWLVLPAGLADSAGQVYVLATTVFFAGVVMAQVGNAFTCRRETPGVHYLGWFSNRFLLAGIVFEILLALALIYVSPLAALFGHVPLPAPTWVGLVTFGPLLYILDRLRKSLAFHLSQRRVRSETGGTSA